MGIYIYTLYIFQDFYGWHIFTNIWYVHSSAQRVNTFFSSMCWMNSPPSKLWPHSLSKFVINSFRSRPSSSWKCILSDSCRRPPPRSLRFSSHPYKVSRHDRLTSGACLAQKSSNDLLLFFFRLYCAYLQEIVIYDILFMIYIYIHIFFYWFIYFKYPSMYKYIFYAALCNLVSLKPSSYW